MKKKIGFGVVGGGYMGKAHAVALNAVTAVFNTSLRPSLECICTTTEKGAADKASQFGFARSTSQWQKLVDDPAVEAVVIASPQSTHMEIALAAFAKGKHVFCEKPLGRDIVESRAMLKAAEASGKIHMTGFNYIRTPASQLAREIIASGEIGEMIFFKAEHTEDFLADPQLPWEWRCEGRANGNMGDLSPHIINAALALAGPIKQVNAMIDTVYSSRLSPTGQKPVTNDDQAILHVKFESGISGSLFISRVATGKKMGYAYEIFGTKGAVKFDQEDQNALWLYKGDQASARQGFTKIMTGPQHPDYVEFCLGPGHGTGYQDQIIIEQKDFLEAIASSKLRWPTFRDGMLVNQVVAAAWASHDTRQWVDVKDF